MKIKVYVASAFCKNNKGGNKAGVVLDKESLTAEQKKKISARLGFAETAFITKSEIADYKIQYYTPKSEVDLCGHATIASFTVLKYLNYVENKIYEIETKSGILTVDLTDLKIIMMEQTKPKFYEILSVDEIKECFDIDCISRDMPIEIVSTGLKDILVPITDKEKLLTMKPNFESITNISKRYDTIGIHAFTLDVINQGNSALCRNFAPLYEVNEEAATGTSNCALACYLNKHKYINNGKYIFEQGYNFCDPSEIYVSLIKKDEEIEKIFAGGDGYFCSIAEIEI